MDITLISTIDLIILQYNVYNVMKDVEHVQKLHFSALFADILCMNFTVTI
jgi:hypothetical protein